MRQKRHPSDVKISKNSKKPGFQIIFNSFHAIPTKAFFIIFIFIPTENPTGIPCPVLFNQVMLNFQKFQEIQLQR